MSHSPDASPVVHPTTAVTSTNLLERDEDDDAEADDEHNEAGEFGWSEESLVLPHLHIGF